MDKVKHRIFHKGSQFVATLYTFDHSNECPLIAEGMGNRIRAFSPKSAAQILATISNHKQLRRDKPSINQHRREIEGWREPTAEEFEWITENSKLVPQTLSHPNPDERALVYDYPERLPDSIVHAKEIARTVEAQDREKEMIRQMAEMKAELDALKAAQDAAKTAPAKKKTTRGRPKTRKTAVVAEEGGANA